MKIFRLKGINYDIMSTFLTVARQNRRPKSKKRACRAVSSNPRLLIRGVIRHCSWQNRKLLIGRWTCCVLLCSFDGMRGHIPNLINTVQCVYSPIQRNECRQSCEYKCVYPLKQKLGNQQKQNVLKTLTSSIQRTMAMVIGENIEHCFPLT